MFAICQNRFRPNTDKQIKKMKFSLTPKAILTIIYIVGIIGICSPFQFYFLLLSPLNLLITFWFLIKGYGKIEKGLGFSICLLVIITWIIEVVGVKSGQIFGPYYYGNALGLKILDTPPIIGMNWAMLLLSIGCILSSLKIKNRIFFSLLGATFMTVLDILIEPVAIALNFWKWQTQNPPLQNYIAWFLVSFLLFLSFPNRVFSYKNENAKWCLWLQIGFFLTLNIAFSLFEI